MLQELGYRYTPASLYCAEHIIMPRIEGHYKSVEHCYADRINRRTDWFNIIREYCEADPAAIGKAILENNDVYAGIRSKVELEGCRKISDITIWVDASCRLDPEPTSSNELDASSADIIIHNNSSIEELAEKVRFVADMIEGAL